MTNLDPGLCEIVRRFCLVGACWGLQIAGSIAAANPISDENRNPGDDGWREIVNIRFGANYDSVGYIKGYASATSVNKGNAITLYVSVNNPGDPSYSISIYRLGFYQGRGGRLMTRFPSSGYAAGAQQTPCSVDKGPPNGDGMVQCRWAPTYALAVPSTWTSGIYVAKLKLKNPPKDVPGYNYVVFVVRDDSRAPDIVYQQPVATYQAYNQYGGTSLYLCKLVDTCTQGRPAYKESFDRPYAEDGLSSLKSWEQPFIFWLEREGYDVAYTTDIDTHSNGDRLLRSKIFLTAGHGEYWSKQMYDAVQNARDRGVHLAFLGGNTLFWQARFEKSAATSEPNRVITVYRSREADPIADPALKTVNWRNLGRPEQSLLGLQWANGNPYTSSKDSLPWVVADASHWIYAGSGVVDKESILTNDGVDGIIGQEWDTVYADRNGSVPDYVGRPGTSPPGYTAAMPPYLTFDVIEHSSLQPSQVAYAPPAYHYPLTTDAVVYQSLSGAYVFSAGSVMWGTLGQRSTVMQTVAGNVLNKMLVTKPQRLDIAVVNAINDILLLSD
jgi:hypothetical protein